MTHPLTADEMEAAIDHRNAPVGLAEFADLLDTIQRDIEDWWSEHMDVVEDGHLELVRETDDTLVFADHTGHFWGEQLDAMEVEDPETRGAVMTAQHEAANRLVDYSWSTSTPVVVAKPTDFEAGQHFVEVVVNSLVERGLSPGQAWAVYGVKIRGNSPRAWGERTGRDRTTVYDALSTAENRAGHIAAFTN